MVSRAGEYLARDGEDASERWVGNGVGLESLGDVNILGRLRRDGSLGRGC